MINKKQREKILEIQASQWRWKNGKLEHLPLTPKQQRELKKLRNEISAPFSTEEIKLYSKIITEHGGTVMSSPTPSAKSMQNRERFYSENISKSQGKHNLPPKVWEKICKIRNRPIRLVKNIPVGDTRTIHTVIPKGSKGYLIDNPELFALTEREKDGIYLFRKTKLPASIIPYPDVVFLDYGDFKIIPPFFDLSLANAIEFETKERDAST